MKYFKAVYRTLQFKMERDASRWYCASRCDGNLHEWKQQEQQAVLLWLQKTSTVLPMRSGARLSPGFCIFWHICRFPSRPGWCWIHFCISVVWKIKAFIRPPSVPQFQFSELAEYDAHTFWTLYSPVTPRQGERSSPARWEEPFPVSAGNTTALSSCTRGSP